MVSTIFNRLIHDDLVIVDLRGLNPNVMYELGIRHAFNKPVVTLIDRTTPLPWDIDKVYTVTYENPIQASHVEKLVDTISNQIDKAISAPEGHYFSSWMDSIKTKAEIESIPSVGGDMKNVLNNIMNRLDSIESTITTTGGNSKRVPKSMRLSELIAQEIADSEKIPFDVATTFMNGIQHNLSTKEIAQITGIPINIAERIRKNIQFERKS